MCRNLTGWLFGLFLSTGILAGCYFNFEQPDASALATSPVTVEITWRQKVPIDSLKVRLDGQDVSTKFNTYDPDRGATATFELAPGKHNLQAEGTFFQKDYFEVSPSEKIKTASVDFTVINKIVVPKERPHLPVEIK